MADDPLQCNRHLGLRATALDRLDLLRAYEGCGGLDTVLGATAWSMCLGPGSEGHYCVPPCPWSTSCSLHLLPTIPQALLHLPASASACDLSINPECTGAHACVVHPGLMLPCSAMLCPKWGAGFQPEV